MIIWGSLPCAALTIFGKSHAHDRRPAIKTLWFRNLVDQVYEKLLDRKAVTREQPPCECQIPSILERLRVEWPSGGQMDINIDQDGLEHAVRGACTCLHSCKVSGPVPPKPRAPALQTLGGTARDTFL